MRSSNEILKDPKYKSVFNGLGCIKNVVYDMKMKPDTKSIINPLRKVPHLKLNHLKDALDSLCKQGIIEPVTEPTKWINSLVIVEKKSGDLRLCMDLRSLNQGIQLEHYLMCTVEDVAVCLAVVGQAFYQIRVTEATSPLLTFNSAFGRFKYTLCLFVYRLPPKCWSPQ